MTDKRVVVPPAMLQAAHERSPYLGTMSLERALEAALLYQREHPPVPTTAEWSSLNRLWGETHREVATDIDLAVAWIKRMYAPDEPKGIDDLLWSDSIDSYYGKLMNDKLREAYARGLKERG